MLNARYEQNVASVMKIVYFTNTIRPFNEHLLGFICICKSNPHYKSYIITSNKNRMYVMKLIKENEAKNVEVISESSFCKQVSVLFNANITMGSAKGIYKQISRIFSMLNKGRINIKVRPGKVTKASGFIQTGKTNISYLLKEYISHKLFKSFTLVTDSLDKYYCITAYGSCHEALIIHPSPKLIHLNMIVNSSDKKERILFAPTHRSQTDQSPIDKAITSTGLQNTLRRLGWDIVYSCHEHGYISDQIRKSSIKIFDSNWDGIGIVVTDYSSIGADFVSATGLPTVYYLAEDDNFEEKNIIPEYFKIETQSSHIACTENNLIEIISDLSVSRKLTPPVNNLLSNKPEYYFEKIIEKKNSI